MKLAHTLRLTLAAALVGVAFSATADDIGPDKAVELVEQGKIKHFRDLNAIVMGLHPGARMVDTELEDRNGKFVYSLELHDSDGMQWEVDVDAVTGDVLKNKQDPDDSDD
jgi:uncharacterized membrane protein YkoI